MTRATYNRAANRDANLRMHRMTRAMKVFLAEIQAYTEEGHGDGCRCDYCKDGTSLSDKAIQGLTWQAEDMLGWVEGVVLWNLTPDRKAVLEPLWTTQGADRTG